MRLGRRGEYFPARRSHCIQDQFGRVFAYKLQAALHFFGLSPVFVLHATGLVVLAVLLSWHALTGERWRLQPMEPVVLLVEGCIATVPLLAAAGHPVAVRPDVSLYRHARRHHWTIVDWASPPSASRGLNPAGARR